MDAPSAPVLPAVAVGAPVTPSPCPFPRRPARAARARALFVAVALLGAVASAPSAEGQPSYVAPVDGVVIDAFRPPEHFAGPGNRGWEYRTAPGSTVRAAAPGIVAFAGAIGGRLYVSIDHADGFRTTYSGVASVSVVRGQAVPAGERIGTTASTLHFGVRRGAEYLDPALFLGSPAAPGPPPRPRLLPRPGGVI